MVLDCTLGHYLLLEFHCNRQINAREKTIMSLVMILMCFTKSKPLLSRHTYILDVAPEGPTLSDCKKKEYNWVDSKTEELVTDGEIYLN